MKKLKDTAKKIFSLLEQKTGPAPNTVTTQRSESNRDEGKKSPREDETRPSSPKNAFDLLFNKKARKQVLDALKIGVQGILAIQAIDPMRKIAGIPERQAVVKHHWNIEGRRKFQHAVSQFVPETIIAAKQRATILLNNPNWDTNGHPFPEEAIPHFIEQLKMLNQPFTNPATT